MGMALQNLQAVGQMKQKQNAQKEADSQMAAQFKKLLVRDDSSNRSSNFNSSNNIQSCYSFLSGNKNQVFDGKVMFDWKGAAPLSQLNLPASPKEEEHKGSSDAGKSPLAFCLLPQPANQQPSNPGRSL